MVAGAGFEPGFDRYAGHDVRGCHRVSSDNEALVPQHLPRSAGGIGPTVWPKGQRIVPAGNGDRPCNGRSGGGVAHEDIDDVMAQLTRAPRGVSATSPSQIRQ